MQSRLIKNRRSGRVPHHPPRAILKSGRSRTRAVIAKHVDLRVCRIRARVAQHAKPSTPKDHLQETRGQIQNLEQVFKNVGRRAQGEKCPGIDGIKEEHESFMEENEPTELLPDAFITGSATRAEHYEIAAYTGLIYQAKALGERDSAALLEENMRQEKAALKKVDSISKRILKAAKPTAKSSTATRTTTSKSRSK